MCYYYYQLLCQLDAQKKYIVVVQIVAGWVVFKNVKMQKTNRDLLVMLKQELMTPQSVEFEVNRLHELLFKTERLDCFAAAHEMIDLNKYKIHNSSFEIKKFIRTKKNKPFVFLSNLN